MIKTQMCTKTSVRTFLKESASSIPKPPASFNYPAALWEMESSSLSLTPSLPARVRVAVWLQRTPRFKDGSWRRVFVSKVIVSFLAWDISAGLAPPPSHRSTAWPRRPSASTGCGLALLPSDGRAHTTCPPPLTFLLLPRPSGTLQKPHFRFSLPSMAHRPPHLSAIWELWRVIRSRPLSPTAVCHPGPSKPACPAPPPTHPPTPGRVGSSWLLQLSWSPLKICQRATRGRRRGAAWQCEGSQSGSRMLNGERGPGSGPPPDGSTKELAVGSSNMATPHLLNCVAVILTFPS